ncbi:MAG: hypothetical protein ACM34L_04820 [Gemmatimonas sp.]|nr:hypothetical protein [Gemmatimonadaceae bacterium]
MIEDSYRHVASNEPCEYVDQSADECLQRCRNSFNAVRFGACRDAVQANAFIGAPMQIFQYRVRLFGTRERPGEQRRASGVAHRIAQGVADADTRPLKRENRRLGRYASRFVLGCEGIARQNAASDLRRRQ